MITRRTHREPMTPGVALRELRVRAGSQFAVAAALVVPARGAPIEISTTNEVDHA